MNKTILITGSLSGIGKATVKYFSAKGWNVVATMRNPDKEKELTNLDNVLIAALEVRQSEVIEFAIRKTIDRFGKIDVLVNNAGYKEYGLFERSSDQQVINQFDVNVFGVMNTTRAILPHFRANKNGTIVNINSGAGRITLPLISLYAASKFALEGFSEAIALELSTLNIGVKIIEPGETDPNFNNVCRARANDKQAPEEYEKFVEAAGKLFECTRGMQPITAAAIAAVIYTAVTDGPDRLRYVVGNHLFQKRIAAKATMPEHEYIISIKKGYLQFMQPG